MSGEERAGHKYKRRTGTVGHWHYEYEEGDSIHTPGTKEMYAQHYKVSKLTATHAEVRSGGGSGSSVRMPRASLPHFAADLQGKVHGPKGATDADVAAVIAGNGKFLGKGDDGVVFKVGDKVVKASTTVPFQPLNSGHRTPEQARDMLKAQVATSERLRKDGVPGILPSKYVEHGDKGFQVKAYVDIPEKLTPEQLSEASAIVEALNAKGYTVNDTIQLGSHKGKIYLFDTGKVAKSRNEWDVKADQENLVQLYRAHGQTYRKPAHGKEDEYRALAEKWEDVALNTVFDASSKEEKVKAKKQVQKLHAQMRDAIADGFDYKHEGFLDGDLSIAEEHLSKAIKGEERAGHKYHRREPLPGGGFRYFYYDAEGHEQHSDHEEGHHVHAHWEQHVAGKQEAPRHRPKPPKPKPSITSHTEKPEKPEKPQPKPTKEPPVVQHLGTVDGTAHLHHEHHGVQTVHRDDWPAELDQFYSMGLERSYPPSGATVALRLVPEKLLADLEGATDQDKLVALAKRAPDVFARLEKSFEAAAVAPVDAQRFVSGILRRENWSGRARAELVGHAIGEQSGTVIAYHGQIADGAENLAAGDQVKAEHVSAAVGLLTLGGTPTHEDLEETGGTFPDAVAELGKQAEAELDTIRGLLEAAKKDPSKAPELLARAMASDAMPKLQALTLAFPGIRDDASDEVRRTLEELPSVAPRLEPKESGSHTSVFVAGASGKPTAIKAKYKLVEANTLIPSHDPTTFSPNPGYPPGWQERAYHRDKDERAKVENNAQNLRPELLVNTNPDATNGAPIVLPSGVVLGGNSRTMSSQLAYSKGQGGHMKEYLSTNAHQFGFKPEDVASLVNPVLVREVDPENKSDENMQLLVRQMNETFTQAMDPKTMMVAMSRRFNESLLLHMGDSMEETDTLTSYLRNSRSKVFREHLEDSGIIDARNRNAYLDARSGQGWLNEDGVRLVERVIVGKMVGDADLLANTPTSLMSSLARSMPQLVRAENHGDDYNMREDLHQAIDTYNTLRHLASGGKNAAIKMPTAKSSDEEYDRVLAHVESSMDLGAGNEYSAKRSLSNPRALSLLKVMIKRPGVKQMTEAFKAVAESASKNQQLGQGGLLGMSGPSPDKVITGAIDRHLAKEKEKKEPVPENKNQRGLF